MTLGAGAHLALQLDLSYHPASGGRPAGQYRLTYRFGAARGARRASGAAAARDGASTSRSRPAVGPRCGLRPVDDVAGALAGPGGRGQLAVPAAGRACSAPASAAFRAGDLRPGPARRLAGADAGRDGPVRRALPGPPAVRGAGGLAGPAPELVRRRAGDAGLRRPGPGQGRRDPGGRGDGASSSTATAGVASYNHPLGRRPSRDRRAHGRHPGAGRRRRRGRVRPGPVHSGRDAARAGRLRPQPGPRHRHRRHRRPRGHRLVRQPRPTGSPGCGRPRSSCRTCRRRCGPGARCATSRTGGPGRWSDRGRQAGDGRGRGDRRPRRCR